MPGVVHFGEPHLLVECGLYWLLWNIACCSCSCILSHWMDFYFFSLLTQTTAFCKAQGVFLLVIHTSVNFQQQLKYHLLSIPFHRGKPEIIGSNLDILVTVGLSEKVCEDYRLAQEVCNAISKLASNPKVRLLACS